jgi:hypothetical protein
MSRAKANQVHCLCLFVLLALIAGCSERNDKSPINPDTGRHVENWLPAAHMEAAKSDLGSCSSCHGDDLKGGISGVSCTSCHLGSPTSVHPTNWAPVYADHGPYVDAHSTSACANQYCHGLRLTGVTDSGPSCTSCHIGGITSGHPTDWVPVYSTHGPYVKANGTSSCSNNNCHGTALTGVVESGPSCSLCHLGGATAVHPTDWNPVYADHGPYALANGTSSCANQYCHGPSLTGVADSGPSCTSCHMGGPTEIHPTSWQGDVCSNHGPYAFDNGTTGCANTACHGASLEGVSQSGPSCTQCHNPIPASDQCNYCHGIPPDGTAYPNIAGKHAEHMLITGVTCATCHARPCDQHNNGVVDVVFDPSGPAVATGNPAPVFDASAKSCSNIACHIVSAGTFNYSFQGGDGNPVDKTVNIYGNTGGLTPSWYSSGTSCTACHGNPPSNGTDGSNIWHSGNHAGQGPTGAYNQCQLCHPDASSPNNGIGDTITNPSLHRNGTFDIQPAFVSQCFNCH